MIRLYGYAESPNCERVALALAHKGLPTERIEVDPADRSEVRKVSGQDLVPVIKDAGNVIHHSTDILVYLERHYPEPPLFPGETARRAEMRIFLDWFNRVWEAVPVAIAHAEERRHPDAHRLELMREHLREMLHVFEDLLDGREYLLGPFSAADCAAFPFLKHAHPAFAGTSTLHGVLAELHQATSGLPRLSAWLERVNQRPRV